MQFGIANGSTYVVYDGGTGHYTMSGNVLAMTTGPLAGIRYRQVGPNAFRMVDQHDQLTAYVCPWQAGNPAGGHW